MVTIAKTLTALWDCLTERDPTLRLREEDFPLLKRKRLHAIPYRHPTALAKICAGEIGLFRDLEIPVHIAPTRVRDLRSTLLDGLRKGFPKNTTARVQIGPLRTRRYMNLPDLLERWESERSVLSVTDLHFRGTRFERIIDTSPLSSFNILCTDPRFRTEFIDNLEMMTVVISARGNVTDSHTDDCDGTNHCFIGKKLWLAWDRVDGQKRGLQDTTRDEVYDQARFDMSTFLSMPSAKWFIVKEGETLFLPGSLAHKVITLEAYIGVGSFNVTLPGALCTLSRWHLHGTTDIHRKKLLDKITDAILRRVRRLKRASRESQEQWGIGYMQNAVARWLQQEPDNARRLLMEMPALRRSLMPHQVLIHGEDVIECNRTSSNWKLSSRSLSIKNR